MLLLEAARLETEAALRVVELALEREELLLASARAHDAAETAGSQPRRTRTAS